MTARAIGHWPPGRLRGDRVGSVPRLTVRQGGGGAGPRGGGSGGVEWWRRYHQPLHGTDAPGGRNPSGEGGGGINLQVGPGPLTTYQVRGVVHCRWIHGRPWALTSSFGAEASSRPRLIVVLVRHYLQ